MDGQMDVLWMASGRGGSWGLVDAGEKAMRQITQCANCEIQQTRSKPFACVPVFRLCCRAHAPGPLRRPGHLGQNYPPLTRDLQWPSRSPLDQPKVHRNVLGGVVARCAHGARTVRARCAHGSMFLGWLPNLYPVEWPP